MQGQRNEGTEGTRETASAVMEDSSEDMLQEGNRAAARQPDPGGAPMIDPPPGLEPHPEPNPDPTPDAPDPEPDRDPHPGPPAGPDAEPTEPPRIEPPTNPDEEPVKVQGTKEQGH